MTETGLLMGGAIFLAYVVKGITGFGNTLVFSSIVGLFLDNRNISPVELVVGYPSNLLIAWRERRKLNPRVWLPLSGMVLLGSIPGVFILRYTDAGMLKKVFAAVVIYLGLSMALEWKSRSGRARSGGGFGFMGILSGMVCGMFGIGAFLAAYLMGRAEEPEAVKGNLCMVFLVENTFRIWMYGTAGILPFSVIRQSLYLYGFMLAGLAVGLLLSGRINQRTARRVTGWMIVASGAGVLLAG